MVYSLLFIVGLLTSPEMMEASIDLPQQGNTNAVAPSKHIPITVQSKRSTLGSSPTTFCPNNGIEFSMNMCGHNATDSDGIHYQAYNSSFLQSMHMDNCYCNTSSVTNKDKEVNLCILESSEIQINIPIQQDGQYELVLKFADICCSHISHRLFRGFLNELVAFEPMYLPEVNVGVDKRLDFIVGNNITDIVVGSNRNKIVDKKLNLFILKAAYFHEPAIISALYVRNKLCEPNNDAFLCTDENERCEEFSGLGECIKNPLFMLTSCKKSCGLCTTTIPPQF
ncbi:putative prolyl 4-hydroxylase 12, partial [Orchesella cincta]